MWKAPPQAAVHSAAAHGTLQQPGPGMCGEDLTQGDNCKQHMAGDTPS